MRDNSKLIAAHFVAGLLLTGFAGCASRSIKPQESYGSESSVGVQTFPIKFVNQEKMSGHFAPSQIGRITFPDIQKAITSPRPDRILPGQGPKRVIASEQPPTTIPTTQAERTHVITSIALQINTVPIHADVIVDDRYLGQSPLITHIDRHSNHVIQLSKQGYKEKVKLIDRYEFGDQKIYFLIEKLEVKR